MTTAQKRNAKAKEMFGKSWRQLDGFLRHAVILTLQARGERGGAR